MLCPGSAALYHYINIVTFIPPATTTAQACAMKHYPRNDSRHMNLNRKFSLNLVLSGWLLCLGFFAVTPQLRANVYATNVRVNGATTNLVADAGTNLTIGYVLNEPASLGVTIQIVSGGTVVRSLDFPGGAPGTVRGLNEVTWDTSLAPVPSGTYSLAVVARSAGYTNWTQITSDTDDLNTYVADGRGIAVNRNNSSPYYGRVYVSNASTGLGINPGDAVGILKLNSDTSEPEDGASSAGFDGYSWSGGGVSPWKIEVSADNSVYVNDLAVGGQVTAWDPTISSNSMRAVLRQDNLSTNEALSGLAIVGAGTNTQVWMSDTNVARGLKWQLDASLVCSSNDPGVVVITNTVVPRFDDIALDPAGNIYTCANIQGASDPSPRVFRYHAYNPPTPGSPPEANVDWAVGAGDDTYSGASGVAVDPTGTYLAVSFQGPIALGFNTNGNTKILLATNGAVVANLDLGVAMLNDPNHSDTDCAWDAVGNVYYIDNYFSRWRVVSPPGTNQATTLALGSVQIVGGQTLTDIRITRISTSGTTVTIEFSAGANESASAFSLLASASVNGNYSPASNATIVQVSPGLFRATVPKAGAAQFYRVRR
jgi:hypothetical protein